VSLLLAAQQDPNGTLAAETAQMTAAVVSATIFGDVTGGALFGELAQMTAAVPVASLVTGATLGGETAQMTAVVQVASLYVSAILLAAAARMTAKAWPARFPQQNAAYVAAMRNYVQRVG
jgi:hypothetical protein